MYSKDNYSIRDYGEMIRDERRCAPFVEALQGAISPGSVVLEIGTGTGYFAFVAIQAGAARVYAVEPANAIEIARLCAAGIPGSERITWIQGLSTEIDLPEQVDIVIGDLHGVFPFYNNNVASMIDARRRHLKPGGVIIPARDVLRMVPAQSAQEFKNLEVPWSTNACGLDLSAGRPFIANESWRARPEPIDPTDMLATPATWGTIDYSIVESENVDCELTWSVERSGTMHGYYVWFDGELAEGIGFSNAPDLPELVYGRVFFPLEEAIDVIEGDRVETRMSTHLVKGDYVYRWDTRVSDTNGNRKAEFKQSTLRSKPINLKDLKRTRPDHVATLGLDGRIAQTVIEGIVQSHSLGRIAETLCARFPERFKEASSGLKEAARLSLKYSDPAE